MRTDDENKAPRKRNMSANLFEREGATLEEIAEVMGITREAVRQIEASALRKLRQKLATRGYYELADLIPDSSL